MARKLVIFGTAELAELAHFYFTEDSEYEVVAFTVDDDFFEFRELKGLPVIPFSEVVEQFPPEHFNMHVAISYSQMNRLRQAKFEQCTLAGYSLVSYICSKSSTWPNLTIGKNCFVLEGQTIQPDVQIGDNVVIWSGNHLGHGTCIGNHTYISSHVVISGHCVLGQRCFVGVNATLRDFIHIGDDTFIGMNAAVSNNVNSGSVVVGSSGRVLTSDDRRAQVLKRKYFNG